MKITNFAIIFVILVFPFLVINDLKIKEEKFALNNKLRYNAAIEAAVQDAAAALTINSSQAYEAGYESAKKYRANKEEALQAFLKTLSLNFDVDGDTIGMNTLLRYIPAIVVIDYDGYWIYTPQEYTNERNETEFTHVWLPKKPFAYHDRFGNSLNFTLDDYVTVYDRTCNKWMEGRRDALRYDPSKPRCDQVNIPLINEIADDADGDEFDQVRRNTIVRLIQEDLAYYINTYNISAKKLGMTYTFTLPAMSEEDWTNTVDDIGFLAFIQGIPLGDGYYNNYALGGSRIVKTPPIYGTTLNGFKYYYRATCGFNYTTQETFTTEREAAAAGYLPLSCAN
jgi:hypothetical protein